MRVCVYIYLFLILYKKNPTIFPNDVFFNMFMRIIHRDVCSSSKSISDCWMNGNVILTPIDQPLGCFQNFAIIND